jgi:hypothetical protein
MAKRKGLRCITSSIPVLKGKGRAGEKKPGEKNAGEKSQEKNLKFKNWRAEGSIGWGVEGRGKVADGGWSILLNQMWEFPSSGPLVFKEKEKSAQQRFPRCDEVKDVDVKLFVEGD